MGQQQLLLLVLGAIIVGVAIVVGINMFSGSALQANQDAVRQDLLNMTSRAMEWYRKPQVLGGGAMTFTGISFTRIGYSTTLASGASTPLGTAAVDMTNENGTYNLNNASGLIITGYCSEDGSIIYESKILIDVNGKLSFTIDLKTGS